MGISHRTGAKITSPVQSSIRSHTVNTCDVPISDNDFQIIGTSNNNSELRTLESLYILKMKPKLNDSQSSHPLYIV